MNTEADYRRRIHDMYDYSLVVNLYAKHSKRALKQLLVSLTWFVGYVVFAATFGMHILLSSGFTLPAMGASIVLPACIVVYMIHGLVEDYKLYRSAELDYERSKKRFREIYTGA